MEIFKAVSIHLLVPLAGLLIYLKLCYDIKKKSIPKPPFWQIFILFVAFGGWLIILLTLFFWYVSGLLYLGFFFLIIIMPIVIIFCVLSLYLQTDISTYHLYSLRACFVYLILVACLWILMLLNVMSDRR
jgi:hypothetical protein